MSEQIVREIEELHWFFQQWFRGSLTGSLAFARVDKALAPEFELIRPSGERVARAALLSGLRAAQGQRRGADPPFRIWVEDIVPRPLGPGLWQVTYREWQSGPDAPRGRLANAVLRETPAAPSGWQWVHVHETWLP